MVLVSSLLPVRLRGARCALALSAMCVGFECDVRVLVQCAWTMWCTLAPTSSLNLKCERPLGQGQNDLDSLGLFSLGSSTNIGDKYGERRASDSRSKGKQV